MTCKTCLVATARQLLRGLPACALAVAAAAHAQTTLATEPPCTPQTCTLQHFGSVRADTEALYGDVLQALSAHERPALRDDQASWRRHARRHCRQQAPVGARPDAPQASGHHFCMIEQDMQRRAQLRRWLMQGYTTE